MGKGEIEQKQGQAPQIVNFSGPDGSKEKINKGVESLHQLFLNHLLRPKTWTGDTDGQSFFAFRREHIMALADEAQKVLETQPMVVQVDAPVKVFGDIHGQFYDMIHMFEKVVDPKGIPQ